MEPELNPAQRAAVDTLAGPLLVLAGAGSGKTRVVTYRIAALVRSGVPAERIMAVTFTNKAAQEMQHRITERLGSLRRKKRGEPAEPRPQIGTFHNACVRILRRHARLLGYPEKFTIYDRSDQEAVARGVLRELRVHMEMLKPSDFLSIISRWKNSGVRPDKALEAAKTDKEYLAATGYRRYQKAIKLAGAFDFDDLLLSTEGLLAHHLNIREQEAGMFDHVLVDEYQDTNGSQYRIIKFLAAHHRNICVVGDDDQSIYGWRGAEVRHILEFQKDWPEATIVRLEHNYRSTGAILNMANRLIAFNQHRHDKTLIAVRPNGPPPRVLQFQSETEEAKGIVAEIAKRTTHEKGVAFKDFAVLFRTNEQPRPFETELRKAKIPYILTGSQSFFDRKEVRDLLAYLRLIDTPTDELALLRIANIPPRGLGTKTIESLLSKAVSSGKPIWSILSQPSAVAALTTPAQRGVRQLQNLVQEFRAKLDAKQPLNEIVQELISRIDYLGEVRRLYPDAEEQVARIASVEEIVNAIAEYEQEADEPSLAEFIADVALAGKEFGSNGDAKKAANAVSLMTLHSAKGLEFPYVYMIGMEEGLLPHRKSSDEEGTAIDEERRLCYVGVTRAQDELTLSLALARRKWGKDRPTFASRFLYELTGQSDNPNRLKAIRAAAEEFRRSASYG